MEKQIQIEMPELSTRALNKLNTQSNGNGKGRPKQHDTYIEHGRASVRRAEDGGLIVTRHVTLLTFLPAKNLNRWAKG